LAGGSVGPICFDFYFVEAFAGVVAGAVDVDGAGAGVGTFGTGGIGYFFPTDAEAVALPTRTVVEAAIRPRLAAAMTANANRPDPGPSADMRFPVADVAVFGSSDMSPAVAGEACPW